VPDPRSARPTPRIAALDAARALGVVAMVAGHTLDALLAPAAREAPLVVAYWKARGFTAPLFLVAAGWAAAVALGRSGAVGLAAARRVLPRALLLLAIGYALRWPGWGVELLRAGDRGAWGHLLAFDALHAIALSLLAASLVLGLRLAVRERALALALLAVLSVALGMAAPAPLPVAPAALPGHPLAIAAVQAAGGTSPFPLFPWAAYFFVGALLGLVAREGAGRSAAAMAAAGGALVLATAWTGVGTMPSGHPVLFAYRTGAVLLLLAGLSAVPRAAAARLAPLGRASLGVYALHVALVYGWSTHDGLAARVGPTLPPGGALAAAGLVLAASAAATAFGRSLRAAAGAALGALARRDPDRSGAPEGP
jgi:uncharacterized membrane protein